MALSNYMPAFPRNCEVINQCSEQSCSAACKSALRLIIKGESIAGSDKAVDCIFFIFDEQGKIVCEIVFVELRNKSVRASDIIGKFNASEISIKPIVAKLCELTGQESSSIVKKRYLFARKFPRTSTSEYYVLFKKGHILQRRCGSSI